MMGFSEVCYLVLIPTTEDAVFRHGSVQVSLGVCRALLQRVGNGVVAYSVNWEWDLGGMLLISSLIFEQQRRTAKHLSVAIACTCKDWKETVLSWGERWSAGRHLIFQHHRAAKTPLCIQMKVRCAFLKLPKNPSTTFHLFVIPPPFYIRFAIASTVFVILFCVLLRWETKIQHMIL